MGRTTTLTVMFSDIVGSTALLTRIGERDWDDMRRKHLSVLREALAEHEGLEVKNTGDGLMAVFGSVIDAVDGACAMQQRSRQVVVGGTPVGLRIGIATGEATEDEGDWFGAPVVEAARLCALAEANESWATGLVRALAGSQANARFVNVEPQWLKGFDQPVEVCKIESPDDSGSMFAQVERHERLGDQLVGYLDYWESLALAAKDAVGDTCRARTASRRRDLRHRVRRGLGAAAHSANRRSAGRAIGVDPSTTMIEATCDRERGKASASNCSPGTGETPGFQWGVATPSGWNELSNTSAISARCSSKRSASPDRVVGSSLPTPTGAL